MNKYKKIGSLIGFTMLAGSAITVIPLVSTSCGQHWDLTFTSQEQLKAYIDENITSELQNDPGQDYTKSIAGDSRNRHDYTDSPTDSNMIADVINYLNPDTLFWENLWTAATTFPFKHINTVEINLSDRLICIKGEIDGEDIESNIKIYQTNGSVYIETTGTDGGWTLDASTITSIYAAQSPAPYGLPIYLEGQGGNDAPMYIFLNSFWPTSTFPTHPINFKR